MYFIYVSPNIQKHLDLMAVQYVWDSKWMHMCQRPISQTEYQFIIEHPVSPLTNIWISNYIHYTVWDKTTYNIHS